ncbi:MAG: hypothetical protein Q7S15_00085 [bacterium]|nr:hypothetical protein [bacterium]
MTNRMEGDFEGNNHGEKVSRINEVFDEINTFDQTKEEDRAEVRKKEIEIAELVKQIVEPEILKKYIQMYGLGHSSIVMDLAIDKEFLANPNGYVKRKVDEMESGDIEAHYETVLDILRNAKKDPQSGFSPSDIANATKRMVEMYNEGNSKGKHIKVENIPDLYSIAMDDKFLQNPFEYLDNL